MERRLAAIIAADLVDYSKLMDADEAGTLNALSALLKDTIEPLISAHRGRVVKLMGDGVLAEFSSANDGLACAVAWQAGISDGPLRFRIGLNLGDVILQDGDIFGNGVNVAARLEAMAEPGGIWLSDAVHREVRGKSDVAFEDLGERALKNIADPVRVFRVVGEGQAPLKPSATTSQTAREKPAIAILPFRNVSGDADTAFLSDGVSEDIITELSRFKSLSVSSRTASFAFRDQADLSNVAQRLSVDYLVEGGVRQAGRRVRVSVQLIEAETGNQVWTERFDRDGSDLFAVQDDVTRAIVAILPGRVQEDIVQRSARKPVDEMKVFELMLQGKALRDQLSAESVAQARVLLERALVLNPGYARAYMYLADTYVIDIWLGLAGKAASARSMELTRRGVSLDNNDAYLQDQLAFAYLCEELWDDAEAQFEKTLSKITNEAESMAWCGFGFLSLGHVDRAREVVAEAKRLDPLHPPTLDWIDGQIHYLAGDFETAARNLIGPALLNSLAHAVLTGCYAELGKTREAEAALKRFVAARRAELASRDVRGVPDTIEGLAGGFRHVWRHPSDWEKIAAGLRKAGLPD